MAACEWHEEGGTRRLHLDFRDGDSEARLTALRDAITAAERAAGRVLILVRWEPEALDMGFLKQVKDANRRLRHLDVRAAFLGLGGKGGAFAAMFNVRVGHERVRSFDDEDRALQWLEENA